MGIFDFFKKVADSARKRSASAVKIGKTAQERKDISIEILKSQGVPFIDHLPLRYETGEVALREKDEVIARSICSFAAIMCACTIRDNGELTDEDKQGTKDFLDNRFGCIDKLTRMERRVIEGKASYDEAVNMGWKYESLWALLWAMGLVKELDFPKDICDCNFVMKTFSGDFSECVKMRDTDEILQALDLVYRYHWACVNARVNGTKSAGLDEEVVMERRGGLEWLCCKGAENDNPSDEYNAWDYPDLNT
ncbi:DUF4272 domain-containing protein [Campylobacter showae]|uniref:DUF4272 domain-containing protein n=2 Tax=Campylobacter showae TaxID=204 RepID=UPI000F084FF2|nr:DUF4272 domain-containing protein [Campylobacter showae]